MDLVGVERFAMANDPPAVWIPAYSNVAGSLPLDDLTLVERPKQLAFSFVRFRLETPKSGDGALRIEDSTGLQLWIDGAPTPVAAEMKLPLAGGEHEFVLAIDRMRRQTPLSVEAIGPTSLVP
jgi:hypothetical protein